MTITRKISFIVVSLIVLVSVLAPAQTKAIGLTQRSLTLSNAQGSATNVQYAFKFGTTNSYPIGSLAFEFCAEDPIPYSLPCTAPVGLSASGASISFQSGATGFAIDPSSTANKLIIGRIPVLHVAGTIQITFSGMRNPDIANHTYYVRMYAYGTNNGTGASTEDGGIAFTINNELAINSEVPPYLKFCVAATISVYDCSTAAGSFLDFGELSTTQPKAAQHQLVFATNAGYGLGITVTGATLTSGNNTIPALAGATASASGQSQFGFNLRANGSPNVGSDPVGPAVGVTVAPSYAIPNRFLFNSGDIIVTSTGATDNYKLTASYVVNISKQQKPGVYNTSILYICLANF